MSVACDEPTLLERAQVVLASIYLALIPVSEMTVVRSTAFAFAAALALAAAYQSRRGNGAPITLPGAMLPLAGGAVVLWSLASLAWSVHPQYTLAEFRGELMWNTLTAVIFYVAASVPRAWPILVTTALASFTVSASLALVAPLVHPGASAEFWYGDTGYFSTLIVLIAPIALSVQERSPRRIATIATIALIALALAAARETQNRIVFVALAAVFATAAGLAALRWRASLSRAPMRWAIALAALAIALTALFIDAARDKALRDFPPQTSVVQTFADDPRLPLWDVAARMIRESPLIGHGYGRAILAPELREAMGADLYEHPHNLVASVWLQTGAVGVALLALALVALAVRYASFLRSRDDRLAFVGIMGLALVAGFVVKNLTDDFLYRSGAREFFALNAMLLGYGTARLCRARTSGEREG